MMTDIPGEMRAVLVPRYGKADVLEIGMHPVPRLKKGQVLVRVHAAGINPRDWLVREGKYVFKFALPAFPFVPGSDIAGEIAHVGDGSSRWQTGQRVFGMQTLFGGMGAYADYVAIDASALALIPSNISFVQAAALPCAGLTAWGGLHRLGQVRAGSHVLINGASGGVGSYAVQIAKAAGAQVSAVCSAANMDFVVSLGADHVIDYQKQSYHDAVNAVDIFFDAIGRESFRKCARILSPNGRYLTTIPDGATAAQAALDHLQRLLLGSPRKTRHLVLVRAYGQDLERMAALMQSGEMHSPIEQVYPLEAVRAAHERSRSWRTRGKLVLSLVKEE